MTITLPFSVTLPRKTKADKVFPANLNVYRNCHHMTLAQAKIKWKDMVLSVLTSTCFQKPILYPPFRFTYTAYPASNRKFDLGNVLSIVQKFTDDALIETGIITDDSYKVIPVVIYQFGAVDRDHPRVELLIESIDEGFTAADAQILKDTGI